MSFASFRLETLGLRKDQAMVCQRNNIDTAADVLLAPTHELTKKLKWRIEAVQALVRDVSRAIAPRTSSVGVLACGGDGMRGEGSVAGASSGFVGRGGGGARATGSRNGSRSRSRSEATNGHPPPHSTVREDLGSTSKSKSQGPTTSQPAYAARSSSPDKGTSPSRARSQSRRPEHTRQIWGSSQSTGRRLRPFGGYKEGDWIRTGDEGWDRLLGGGVRLGTLVEISGESAAGKSHLALSLSIAAQLPTLSTLPGGTIFLTSEREISTSRLKDISRHMLATHGKADFRIPSRLMEGVVTTRVGDVDELEVALGYKVPVLLERARGGLGRGGGGGGAGGGGGGGGVMRAEGVQGKETGVMGAHLDGGCSGTSSADQEDVGAVRASPPPPGSRLLGFPKAASIHAEFAACRTIVNAERLSPPSLSASRLPASAHRSNGQHQRTNHAHGHGHSHMHEPRLPIRLIVLDSITALLRGADTAFSSSSAGLTARSRFLCNTADRLKALAVEYNLAVVIINQVSDVFDRRVLAGVQVPDHDEDEDETSNGTRTTASESHRQPTNTMPPPALPSEHPPHPSTSSQSARPSQAHPSSSQSQPGVSHSQAWATTGPDPPMLYATQSKWFSGQSSARTKEAALGVVWANAINVRLMLSRTGRRRVVGKGDVAEGAERGTKRRLVDELRAAGDESGVSMAQARYGNGNGTGNNIIFGSGLHRQGTADNESNSSKHQEVRVEWQDAQDAVEEERILIRRAQCVFSPNAPSATIDYVITCSGIHSIVGTWKREDTGEEVLRRQKRLRAAVKCGVGGGGGEGGGAAYDMLGSYDDEGEKGEGEGDGDPYDEEGMFGGIEDGGLEGVPEGWWSGAVGGG